MIVGGVRDVRRHMDGLSHLKTERARENTKGGVGQYVVAGASKATQVKTVAGHYKYSTISKLMKTYLLLPHSNADSERVFSMVNKICTEHRADLAQDMVAALLSVKVNSRVDPQRFEPSRNELGKAKSATMEYNRLQPCTLHDVTCSFVEPSLDELKYHRLH